MDKRFSRQLVLPQIGQEGQQKLQNAAVLLVGLGGLGCPASLSLAAAGIGTIGLADFDVVNIENLNRQTLFSPADLGRNKAEVAKEKLQIFNPTTHYLVFSEGLNWENGQSLFENFDIILDCTDRVESRLLINYWAEKLDKTVVFAALHRFEGQVAVFNYPLSEHIRSANWSDFFSLHAFTQTNPNCGQDGMMGFVSTFFAQIQVGQCIKILLAIEEAILYNKILVYNTLKNKQHVFSLQKKQVKTKAIDPRHDLGLSIQDLGQVPLNSLKFVSLAKATDELSQFEQCSVEEALSKDWADDQVVFFCQSGIQAQWVSTLLTEKYARSFYFFAQDLHLLEFFLLQNKKIL